MAKLTKALFSFSAKGSLGKALSFRRKGSQTIAKKMPVVPDAKSLAQLSWRHMYQKAVALWHLLSAEEQADWESKARIRHMTGFAWFMSQCLKPNPGIYLPLQGGTMSGDIDMATHRILDLPLPDAVKEPVRKKDLSTHAALPAVHHTKYTNEEALAAAIAGGLSKVIWKDADTSVLNDNGRTSNLDWTDLDLTAATSSSAKLAIVILRFKILANCSSQTFFLIRKNGTTPAWMPGLIFDSAQWTAIRDQRAVIVIGLDSEEVIEYKITAGGGTVDSDIAVIGYIE